jgi:predicted Zn-dependent protease with MMP-like domain
MSRGGSDAEGWANCAAPSLDELEVLARQAFARLPQPFRSLCQGVVFRVDDFPSDDVLDELDAETPFDIMGLYQGVSLTGRDQGVPVGPDMVFLYRRPILDYWAEGDDTLGAIIAHVLVHEIGHHFGLSDSDMEAIETAANNPTDGPRAVES